MKREVLEETGLEFEPSALLSVEFQSLYWIRFTFTGQITGGELKTEEKADKESLRSQWIPWKQLTSQEWQLRLRSADIMPLITQTLKWYSEDEGKKVQVLPNLSPLTHCFVRTLLVEKIVTGGQSRSAVQVVFCVCVVVINVLILGFVCLLVITHLRQFHWFLLRDWVLLVLLVCKHCR